MRQAKTGLALILLAAAAPIAAHAEDTVKIAIIMSYSGQFADSGAQIENGIKLYMKQHGDTVAGKKIEIIRKDNGGIAPDVSKRLSQEAIVRDKADILAGFDLTPNALAAADVSAQAKKFMVNMNAATSIITTKSPYMVRTSFTVPAVNQALGAWAAKNGIKKAYTLVSDFSPGHDGEAAFQKGFKDNGGEIIGSARYPVPNQDFTAFLQRAKDLAPDAIYIWVPGGTQPATIGKNIAERGIDKNKTKILGQGELTFDESLKGMGDDGLGGRHRGTGGVRRPVLRAGDDDAVADRGRRAGRRAGARHPCRRAARAARGPTRGRRTRPAGRCAARAGRGRSRARAASGSAPGPSGRRRRRRCASP